MSKKELGFGIIGCGMIAKWHADAILEIPGTRIIGVTDLKEESRRTFAEKYNISVYDSIDEMLASKEIDVVCICTPSGLHAVQAIKAAQAGKNIIVEKPMALNLDEADEIIKACEENGVKLAVISQLRFSEAVIRLKSAVEDGQLGRIVMGDVYMKYYRSQEYYNNGGWRGTWKMDGGGALMNQGIHGIDLLLYVMGPVKSVYANARTLAREIEVEDTAAAIIEFRNGALGVIQGTTSVYPGFSRRMEINGDRGSIILEEDSIIKWDIMNGIAPKDLIIGASKSGSASNPAAFGIEGHILQIGDMVDSINNNRKPLVDQYEGRKPIELIMAIYESSKTVKAVSL